MRRFRFSSRVLSGVVLALALSASTAAAEAVSVVASIKPVHSLTAAVMQGAGSPHLIVQGGNSPHSYSLRPSDAAALEEAQVVVWVGEGLETFLQSSITALAGDAEVVGLAEVAGLTRLPYREGGPWAEHAHGAEADHAETHGEVDMHLWLDPDNAKAMVAAIARALIAADPDNSDIYSANRDIATRRLDQLAAEIARELAPVKDRPFVVFHDAFQYFDKRFGLNNVGSVTVDPDRKPGAARLKAIQARIAESGVRCVFAEPQFEPRLLQVVIEGTTAELGSLDPLGAELADGPELYFELMRRNAAAFKACLGPAE